MAGKSCGREAKLEQARFLIDFSCAEPPPGYLSLSSNRFDPRIILLFALRLPLREASPSMTHCVYAEPRLITSHYSRGSASRIREKRNERNTRAGKFIRDACTVDRVQRG